MKKLLVGSRESRLAVLQTQIVTDLIQKHHPDYQVELVTMKRQDPGPHPGQDWRQGPFRP